MTSKKKSRRAAGLLVLATAFTFNCKTCDDLTVSEDIGVVTMGPVDGDYDQEGSNQNSQAQPAPGPQP